MLDTFLRAARASREKQLTWFQIRGAAIEMLSKASPRAIVLASPHVPWDWLIDRGDLVELWARATSAVPHTDEICQSVVDVLLQIASKDQLIPYIPVDVWSWLTKRPTLPPVCMGRHVGTRARVVKAVRALKDIEVLKSYLLIVWSEWDDLQDNSGFNKMCTSIREDFSGIEMRGHRAELIRRLGDILGRLYQGVEQLNPQLGKYDLWKMKRRYGKLMEVLLEVEECTSSPITMISRLLTPALMHVIS